MARIKNWIGGFKKDKPKQKQRNKEQEKELKKVKGNPIIIEIKITQANHVQGLLAQ